MADPFARSDPRSDESRGALDADVLIVGAGPAGSTAAIALRALGVKRVVVLDAATFPRAKPCGGVIARRGVDALRALGVPLRVPHVMLDGAEIRGGARRVALRARGTVGVVVRREEFDASLVDAARSRGADVREGVRVTRVGAWEDGARVVTTTAGTLRAGRVIGADGATSRVSGTIRAERGGPPPRLASAIEVRTHAGADDPAAGRMRYDFSLSAARGYAWDFPCRLADGAGFNRGVYSPHPRRLSSTVPAELDAFLARRKTALAEPPQSWPERLYDERRPLSAPGLFLAGEAIGVNAVTGEGIAPAIESALFAARWAARADGAWEGYTHAFRRSMLGRRLSFGTRLAKLLYGEHGRFYRDLGIADARFQELLLADFAGDLDIPHWKRWLMARLALDVVLQAGRELLPS